MRTLQLDMRGTDIMEIQSLLKKAGLYTGPVDGIFGTGTRQAVMKLQQQFGIQPDGIIGPITYRALEPLLLGYTTYTVQPGDSATTVAQKFGTTVTLLRSANPNVNINSLLIGQSLIVPYGIDVVNTDTDYTYEVLEHDIFGLKARYPFLDVRSIGKSVLGRNLYALRFGTGPNRVAYNGAHHALEWITSPVLMKFVEDLAAAYASGRMIDGYDPNTLWQQSTITVIPMVNPDGIELVLNGLEQSNPYYADLIEWNNGSTDFSKTWQANIRGVDLNHNYDAKWTEYKEVEAGLGITGPAPTRYGGPRVESEPEVQAMVAFTQRDDPALVLAYHSQGEVIYWNFENMAPPEALPIGQALAKASGYALEQAGGVASYAGYKDWVTKQFRIPGYTVEVGIGKNPLPISQFDTIYKDNLPLLLAAATLTSNRPS